MQQKTSLGFNGSKGKSEKGRGSALIRVSPNITIAKRVIIQTNSTELKENQNKMSIGIMLTMGEAEQLFFDKR
jgi:hypothetical protein